MMLYSSATCSAKIEQHLRLNECFKEHRLILHNLAACKILGNSEPDLIQITNDALFWFDL